MFSAHFFSLALDPAIAFVSVTPLRSILLSLCYSRLRHTTFLSLLGRMAHSCIMGIATRSSMNIIIPVIPLHIIHSPCVALCSATFPLICLLEHLLLEPVSSIYNAPNLVNIAKLYKNESTHPHRPICNPV